jgi:ParB-like nuclease domain
MASERWPNGGSRAWRKLRAQVLERDGGRCTHVVDVDGNPRFVQGDRTPAGTTRCDHTTRLEVHHSRPGPAVEADLEDLYTVCKKHHPKPGSEWQAETAAAAAEAAIAAIPEVLLDTRTLMPALWNANHVPRETMERIKTSVRTFGIVENIVIRPHPEFEGKYEVLSGNHRLQIYKQLRVKKIPCKIVNLDDAMARVLAQTLNRTRGVDDPQKLAALMDEIHAALPKQRVDEFLQDMAKLPPGGLDGKAMTRLLEHQRNEIGVGYTFKPINPMKLGHRMEACCHPRRMRKALELFAGRGQLTFWYARLFDQIVRVDADPEGAPDHQMSATEYIRTRLVKDGPFDLVDFDDEGSPHEELDAFFEVIKEHRQEPFVLCVTDGLAHRLKLIRKVPTDLQTIYRWPEREAKGKHLYLRCPELLDHGVKARAEEAGYTAETIAVDWKPGKAATFGSWLIGPEDDTRTEIEKGLEGEDALPEAWGAWRIEPKPRERKPPVEAGRSAPKKKRSP